MIALISDDFPTLERPANATSMPDTGGSCSGFATPMRKFHGWAKRRRPASSRAASAALIEGVELTLRELTNVMTKHGVTPVSPAVGDQFDPQLHQAMFEAPLPGTKAGQIIQVMTEGFLLHDRLLRPAQVGVSSNVS